MKLIWTEPSVEDLRSIRDYIARDSEIYAVEFVGQVVLSVERLLLFPTMGRMVPEAHDVDIRELIYQSYRIIYRIVGERIEILTIVHGSRDLTKLKSLPWEIA